ncbi:MAG: SU10 major capsid protein, partial [Planctomycetota bacterium]
KDNTYGLQIRTLVHAWGELKLVNHPLFSEHSTWTKNMYIVDTRNVLYRYLKGRDTRFLRERQGNGEDRVTHEFMTKCSLEVRHERTHGIATAIDTFVG